MVLLARKDEEGNTQTLYDHLHGAGRLASGFEDEFADISRTAAVLHDVGKVAQQFQTYLLSDDGHRGDVQHARQGAFVVNDFFESKGEIEEIAKEILELAISKHHGGLPDCIDESGNRAFLLGFTESDKSNEKYAYQEIKRGLNGLALDLQSNFRGSAEDIACFLKKIKSLGMSKDSIYFYLGLLVKLIYSRLVDADRTDAACFETRKQYRPNTVDWQNLISRLDKSMRSFDSSSEINRIRHQINEQCCLAGARETGIYRLSIPTGGGKTLASLNFALHHALKTGKHRIIYVIPYLSITTQTAKTFRDVLGLNADSDVLLEHYSTAGMQRSADVADNASSEFEDAGEHQRKLAAERWDNPIIVTTMVEFLETVMSARGTKLRKFHNMADSVIIFDEIQSLPMNTINLFNEIVSFLSKITNSTILLCSATQPLLEKTKRENLLLSEKPDLIAETESYEDKLRRTRIVASTENKSCDELGQIIQHFSFCKRQWALIHVEQLWSENYLTTAGHLEHERAHDYAASESRGDMLIMRDLRVYSRALGITGACDVVEFHKPNDGVPLHGRDGLWLPYPIEYKHGKSKTIDADRLQLCAEAMCLEEMLACDIPEGALFYQQTKRRERVKFDEDLRNMVEADFLQMHDLFSRGWTPKVKQTRSCSSCSLRDLCLPELRKVKSAKAYIEELLKESGE